ncbi:MAG: hypothetical protein AABZ14_09205, partial [Candidatus Margulisiibacteriota bacterium]
INGSRGDGGDEDVRLVSTFGSRFDGSRSDSLMNQDEISSEMIRYYFEVGKIVKRRLQWEILQDEKATYASVETISGALNFLSGTGLESLQQFISDNGTKYSDISDGSDGGKLLVRGSVTSSELTRLKSIYDTNGTDNGSTDRDNRNLGIFQELSGANQLDSTSETLAALSGTGLTELQSFITNSAGRYLQNGSNGTQLVVRGVMTVEDLDTLERIYDTNGTDNGSTDRDRYRLEKLKSAAESLNAFDPLNYFKADDLEDISYEEFMALSSLEFKPINETDFKDGSHSVDLWKAATEIDQLNSMIDNDATFAMSVALDDSDGSYWSNLNEDSLAGGSSGDPAWLGTGEGVFALESRETILRQVKDAIQSLIPMYKRNSTDDAGDSVDSIFGDLSPGSDLMSVLDLIVDKKSRIFKDIFQVNEFNRLNYGDVNWINGTDGSARNVNTLAIGGLGYFPENFKTTMNTSFVHPTKRPVVDEKGGLTDQRVLSTQVSQLDKEYLDMILEMQKMNSFYMMMPFSSPTNGTWDGTSVSAISDRDGDGTVTGADLRYNFLTPLETLYGQVSGTGRKEFTDSDMASSLVDTKLQLTGEYLKTLNRDDGTSVFDGSYYADGPMMPAISPFNITDDNDVKYAVKKVFPALLDEDFSDSGTNLTLTTAGLAKITDFNHDPLGRAGTSWPAGEPKNWIPKV